jgi:uncharacterized protein (DUF1697 family)
MIKKYIAVLRGINVSGKNMIKMPLLTAAMQRAEFCDVQTYLQSGNVVFTSSLNDKEEISKRIELVIQSNFDLSVPVLIISVPEIIHIRESNPFISTGKDTSGLHVTLLDREPDKTLLERIDKEKCLPDEFVLEGKTIYLHCPAGYGKTKLTNNFFESKLKQTATTRNWNTVCRLSDMVTAI